MSTDVDCCSRVVELCRQCLVIVYVVEHQLSAAAVNSFSQRQTDVENYNEEEEKEDVEEEEESESTGLGDC